MTVTPSQPRSDAASLRELWEVFRNPVHAEDRRRLRELWQGLPEPLRGPRQMVGRQVKGCGATIGVEPRCDFRCSGCYLGSDANQVPGESLPRLRAQLRVLREHLGRWGNLQLTDGEVTLRPADELVELLRYARSLELTPMLMTHGDSFRRRPDLLERLVVEGGLREVCLHVDTTQRGRRGGFDRARREEDLDPVRDELADVVRRVRRDTGIPLRAASTVSVDRDNLDGVPGILRWALRNPDVLRIVSFQPLAQVGRTEEGLGGRVTRPELWERIAEGLLDDPAAGASLEEHHRWFGHPECTRVTMGWVASDAAGARYHPLDVPGDEGRRADLERFFARWGGLGFRPDDRARAVARALGVVAGSPGLFLRRGPGFVRGVLRQMGPPLGTALRLARGRMRIHPLAITSHHFMDAAQLRTSLGRERAAACIFHTVVDGRPVSMCEANALGGRDRVYAELVARRGGDREPAKEVLA